MMLDPPLLISILEGVADGEVELAVALEAG